MSNILGEYFVLIIKKNRVKWDENFKSKLKMEVVDVS